MHDRITVLLISIAKLPPPQKKKIHFLTGWADLGWGHGFFCFAGAISVDVLIIGSIPFNWRKLVESFPWPMHTFLGKFISKKISVCMPILIKKRKRHLWKNTITMVWPFALLNRRFSLGVQGIRGTSFSEPGGGGVWFRVNGLNECEGFDDWVHHTVDGSEIPNNHLGICIKPL